MFSEEGILIVAEVCAGLWKRGVACTIASGWGEQLVPPVHQLLKHRGLQARLGLDCQGDQVKGPPESRFTLLQRSWDLWTKLTSRYARSPSAGGPACTRSCAKGTPHRGERPGFHNV